MTEKRCRHKWEWTPITWTHHEDLTRPADATNAKCAKCEKTKWGHGRNPHTTRQNPQCHHARAANTGRGQHM